MTERILAHSLSSMLVQKIIPPDLLNVISSDKFFLEELLCQYPRVFNGGANGQVVFLKHT